MVNNNSNKYVKHLLFLSRLSYYKDLVYICLIQTTNSKKNIIIDQLQHQHQTLRTKRKNNRIFITLQKDKIQKNFYIAYLTAISHSYNNTAATFFSFCFTFCKEPFIFLDILCNVMQLLFDFA